MALVKCPECKKENVSDQAENCPNCGFPIRNHYDELKKIKKKNEEIQNINNQRKRLQDDQIRRENIANIQAEEKKQKLINRQKELEKHTIEERKDIAWKDLRKKLDNEKVKPFISLIGLLLSFVVIWIGSIGDISIIFIIVGFAGIMFSLVYFFSQLSEIHKLKKYIKLVEEDVTKYEKIMMDDEIALIDKKTRSEIISIRNDINSENKELDQIIREKEIIDNNVLCPNCGSKNTKKISTLNRAVSVELVGLASSKIGKQYQCNSCGHKW